jgi:hypothetical protein
MMTPEELAIRVVVLEERLARLAGAFVVLLEAIDAGAERRAASQIREAFQDDLDEKLPP